MSESHLAAASVSENDTDPASELELNIDDLNWQGQRATSLCDRFQIHMFTDQFEQTQEKVRTSEKQDREAILTSVLHAPEDGGNKEAERIFQTIMDADTEAVIKFGYSQNTGKEPDIAVFLYLFGGIAITGLVWWIAERRRRRK